MDVVSKHIYQIGVVSNIMTTPKAMFGKLADISYLVADKLAYEQIMFW